MQGCALAENYPAYIFHRMYRSELEYISLLQRGRPSDSFPFKRNRPGYIKSCNNERFIEFDELAFNNYEAQFNKFLLKIEIGALLDTAQENIKKRAKKTVEILTNGAEKFTQADVKDLKRIFSGIQDASVLESIEKIKHLTAQCETPIKVEDKPASKNVQYGIINKYRTKFLTLAKRSKIRK